MQCKKAIHSLMICHPSTIMQASHLILTTHTSPWISSEYDVLVPLLNFSVHLPWILSEGFADPHSPLHQLYCRYHFHFHNAEASNHSDVVVLWGAEVRTLCGDIFCVLIGRLFYIYIGRASAPYNQVFLFFLDIAFWAPYPALASTGTLQNSSRPTAGQYYQY